MLTFRQILQQSMGENCKIVFSKAKLVSEFRQKFDLPKSRIVNDLHHANDAYLNIVVGNAYYVKFTGNPYKFIKNAKMNPKLKENKYHISDFYRYDIYNKNEVAWRSEQDETIDIVKRTMERFTSLVTRKLEQGHGEYFKETIFNNITAKKESYIGVKTKQSALKNVNDYGGKRSISTQGYALVEYTEGNKTIRLLKEIPIILGDYRKLTEDNIIKYINDILISEVKTQEARNIRVCEKFIPMNSLIKIDGAYYYLGGKTEEYFYARNAMQLKLDRNWVKYVHKIEKANSKNNYDEVDNLKNKIITSEKNQELFDLILSKFDKLPYSNCKAGPLLEHLNKARKNFIEADTKNQCIVLEKMIRNISKSEKVDLSSIGGKANVGSVRINTKISNYKEFKLISQSSSGLFENEKDLLKI